MFLQIMQEDVAPPLGDDHDSAAGELFEVPILGRVARGGVDHELPRASIAVERDQVARHDLFAGLISERPILRRRTTRSPGAPRRRAPSIPIRACGRSRDSAPPRHATGRFQESTRERQCLRPPERRAAFRLPQLESFWLTRFPCLEIDTLFRPSLY